MRRTTVYLTHEQKTALEQLAVETGRSEAELIREGVQLAVTRHTPPGPRSGIFASGEPCLSERTDELLEGFGQT